MAKNKQNVNPLSSQKAITFLCFVGFIKGGKIGDCVSKPAAAAARKKVVVKRFSPPHQSPSAAAAVATKGHSGLLSSKSGQLAGNPNRMKGLFKSKPRTPADVVRQTRDLLIYVDQSSSSLSDSKREEKVGSIFIHICTVLCVCVFFPSESGRF